MAGATTGGRDVGAGATTEPVAFEPVETGVVGGAGCGRGAGVEHGGRGRGGGAANTDVEGVEGRAGGGATGPEGGRSLSLCPISIV